MTYAIYGLGVNFLEAVVDLGVGSDQQKHKRSKQSLTFIDVSRCDTVPIAHFT